MKQLYYFMITGLAASLICAGGCARRTPEDGIILAKASNRTITLREFRERLGKLPAYYQSIVNANKEKYLDDMIIENIFYEEAVRRGIDKEREIKDVIHEAKKKIVIAKLIKAEVEDKLKVDEAEIGRFYDEHKGNFKTRELWRASHILVSTEEEAKAVEAQLAAGAPFEELAKKHSIDATASRLGDVGYFRKGQVAPEFERVCFELKVGETSGIVKTQFGYHIIRLTDKRGQSVEPLENVRVAIETELKKQKRSALFDELSERMKKKYGVEVMEGALKQLDDKEKKK